MCLRYWLHTANGPVCCELTAQPAVFFVASEDVDEVPRGAGIEIKDLPLKHFDQRPVSAVYCRSYRQLMDLRNKLEELGIPAYEADIKPHERYLMERFIRGGVQLVGGHWQAGILSNPRLMPVDYQPHLQLLSLDIETSMPTASEPEQLYAIGFSGMGHKRVFMLGEGPATYPGWIEFFSDVVPLLQAATDFVRRLNPDVLIGWNVIQFDLRVLQRIYQLHQVPFTWGRNQEQVNIRQGQNNLWFADVPGRVVVDGIDGLKNATWSFESFSLQYVSQAVLGEGKKIEDVDNRGQAITDLFHENKIALAEYNLQDCELVEAILAKTHLLAYLIKRSHLTGHMLDRVGGSVAAFEYLYLPKLHRAGYIAPNMGDGYAAVKAPGGFVMDSQPGLYKHVLVLDFKSLYPSIIRTFFIDPMGLAEGLLFPTGDGHCVPGFNGGQFHRQRHLLPDIIRDLWQARDEAKRQKDAAASQAIKIIMNSFYGVLGSPGCRFFDVRLSSSITQRGHQIIQQSARLIEEQGYQVIYGDTDSVFVWLKDKHTAAQANEVGAKLAADLNLWWQAYLKTEFNLASCLEIQYETHYQKFLMPTIRGSEMGSKKRYAGQKPDGEMVFKGLEVVRTDWTRLAREVQEYLYQAIFNDEPYLDYLLQVVHEVRSGQRDAQLIYRKRIRQPLSSYVRNVPPHAQAAKKLDEYRISQGLMPRYERRGWVEYVMTINGPEPLEYIQSPLDYQHYLDRQLAPVVDGILHFQGKEFAALINPQGDLF